MMSASARTLEETTSPWLICGRSSMKATTVQAVVSEGEARVCSGRRALLVTLVVCEIGWIATQARLVGGFRWLPVLVLLGLHLRLVSEERRQPLLSGGTVILATVVVAVGAVATAPFGSRDLFQYAMYGRMVTAHGVSPYTTVPAAIHGDRLLAQLAPAWQHTLSVYGPAFTAVSALGARAYGDSPLLARLYFQGFAAVALVAGVIYGHRRGMTSASLVLLGLSPVLVAVVNGGHNDLLVGVLVLVGVDLGVRSRPGWGGVVLGLACSVKLLALPAVAAVVVAWALARRWRAVEVTLASAGAVVGASYAAAGGVEALRPLGMLGGNVSRASAWSAVGLLHGPALSRASALFVIGAGAVVLARAWRSGSSTDPAVLTVALGTLACFGAPYLLPWYPAAFLPLSARCLGSVPQRALALGSAALLVAYVQPPGLPAGALVLGPTVATVAGLVVGSSALWIVFSGRA